MSTYIITSSEMEASHLLYGKYGKGSSTKTTEESVADIRDAAEYIIVLAERIKSDRAIAAMSK